MLTPIDYVECAKLGVATIYEAAGRQGLIDVALEQLIPRSRVAGQARTVRNAQDDNLMVHAVIERITPGDIVVLTMPQAAPVALIGDLLVTQLLKAGAAGVLVDAAVRDAEELAQLGLPVWSRWIRVRGATKVGVGEIDVPVTVGGTPIAPGDLVVLDADGACTIPQARAHEVLVRARERDATEARNRTRYANGERSYDINHLRSVVCAAKSPAP